MDPQSSNFFSLSSALFSGSDFHTLWYSDLKLLSNYYVEIEVVTLLWAQHIVGSCIWSVNDTRQGVPSLAEIAETMKWGCEPVVPTVLERQW